MSRTGTNNGGGARWALMERATCPVCFLHRAVGARQDERQYRCANAARCAARAAKLNGKRVRFYVAKPGIDGRAMYYVRQNLWVSEYIAAVTWLVGHGAEEEIKRHRLDKFGARVVRKVTNVKG